MLNSKTEGINQFSQLVGLVGGTMGLLTGFSVLSAVEIVYYGLKVLKRFLAVKRVRKEP